MGDCMRSMDWSRTPLGDVESWSLALRMMAQAPPRQPFSFALFWGPSYCQFYNDPSRPILGKKHPRSMGQPAEPMLSRDLEHHNGHQRRLSRAGPHLDGRSDLEYYRYDRLEELTSP